jgi:hypothetical protein
LQKLNYLIWTARRKGNVPHNSYFSIESNHNSGMLEEIEGSTISLSNQHKVYPRSSIPHQHWQIIMATFSDIVQRYRPCEDAELELQRFRGEADSECSVIHQVEEEENKKEEESSAEDVWTTFAYLPDQQHQEENRQACEKRFRPIGGYSLLVN